MASATVLSQKQQIVEELAGKLKNSIAGVLVDYQGITVEDDTALRAALRKAGVDYAVVKNTLLSKACDIVGLQDMKSVLNGMTAMAFSENDPVAAAKILSAYAEKHENYKVKIGFVQGNVINSAEVGKLAKLPSKEELIAKILGSMNAPIAGLVTVLNGNIKGLVVALNAIKEKQEAIA
ncbi:MAG: 50S ribosomal protein L10 [Clostridiales bacterium GWF2_38_85]|nr:MAG: 50S ribosomal protein L10 [Clostridiales bacterium GWF2_38_85]HBL83628.1 50S ribosomal protein L10 [Clostridiales bacterium]